MTAYEQEMETLKKRVHDLEHQVAGGLTNLGMRVSGLEAHSQVARRLADHIADPERERKADWKRTRDAALGGLLAKDAGEGVSTDEFLSCAALFADRAHGPLEAKAESVTNMLLVTRDQSATYSINVDHVDALVKAAAALRKAYDEFSQTDVNELVEIVDERMEVVRAALKPFEREQK